MANPLGADIEDDLRLLDAKLKQLRREYEQYFLGQRNREPRNLRGEVQKIVSLWSNLHISNTALRFRFNNLASRFFSYRQRWDKVQRQIEDGTYERHVFKAKLHESERAAFVKEAKEDRGKDSLTTERLDQVYQAYLEACRACGKDTKGVTRQRLAGALRRQEQMLRERYGCGAVNFRVVVENGRAKLKVSPGES